MKKAQTKIMSTFLAVAIISLIVIVGYNLPNKTFWPEYGYTPGSNNITDFDQSAQLKNTAETMGCDLKLDPTCGDSNPITDVAFFIQGLVRSGYAGVVTFYKSFGITKVMISNFTIHLNIPEEISALLTTMVLLMMIVTVILIIFNRSDLA